MSKIMLVVNLHEIEFLNDVLAALAQRQVLDCMVQQVECMPSYHGGDDLEPNMLASVAGLFKPQHNVNYVIAAVTEQKHMEDISSALKGFYKEDRYACSFWFVPIDGYWYHKTEKPSEADSQ